MGHFMVAKARTKVVRAKPVKMEVRWTAAKQEAFLAALADTASVAGAARAVGVPESSPYKIREKDVNFRAGWDAALDRAYARLELMLLRRATFGEQCDGPETPAISSSVAMALLRHYKTRTRRGEPNLPQPVRGSGLRDRLQAKLSDLNRRGDVAN